MEEVASGVALGEAFETERGMIGEESRFPREAKISTVFQGNTQGSWTNSEMSSWLVLVNESLGPMITRDILYGRTHFTIMSFT